VPLFPRNPGQPHADNCCAGHVSRHATGSAGAASFACRGTRRSATKPNPHARWPRTSLLKSRLENTVE
jgi:hypothetical protein